MSNYKINIDKPPLNEERINKHKNFHNLMDGYAKVHDLRHVSKAMYRDKKMLRIIIVIIAVALAIFLADRGTEKSKDTDKNSPQTTEDNAPKPSASE